MPRRFAVIDPLKVTITNVEDEATEWMTAMNHPNQPEQGEREIPFSRNLWIERDDFMEDAPRKFFRLKPGGEVRLRYAYIMRCDDVIKDEIGNVIELLCSIDKDTRSGSGNERKVKGTIHWVSADHAIPAAVNLYDRLFKAPAPGGDDFLSMLNPESLRVAQAQLEPSLEAANATVQFERLGFFTPDVSSSADKIRFNRVVTLRDSWAKLEKQAMLQLERG
mgnify:CR=1 FL=1